MATADSVLESGAICISGDEFRAEDKNHLAQTVSIDEEEETSDTNAKTRNAKYPDDSGIS
jgi:hypothetical protein